MVGQCVAKTHAPRARANVLQFLHSRSHIQRCLGLLAWPLAVNWTKISKYQGANHANLRATLFLCFWHDFHKATGTWSRNTHPAHVNVVRQCVTKTHAPCACARDSIFPTVGSLMSFRPVISCSKLWYFVVACLVVIVTRLLCRMAKGQRLWPLDSWPFLCTSSSWGPIELSVKPTDGKVLRKSRIRANPIGAHRIKTERIPEHIGKATQGKVQDVREVNKVRVRG